MIRKTIEGTTASTFSPGTGIVPLPGTTNGGSDYRFFGGINPSGNRIALFDVSAAGPSLIYHLTNNTISPPPPVPTLIGPISSVANNTVLFWISTTTWFPNTVSIPEASISQSSHRSRKTA